MKTCSNVLLISFLAAGLYATSAQAGSLSSNFKSGKVDLQSAGPIAFGPEGILFVADPQSAAIFAIETGDTSPGEAASTLKVEGLNQKVAAVLGTAADQIRINDLAVNPISHNAYLSVSRGRGPDAASSIIRVKAGGKIEALSTDSIRFAKASLPDAPADAEQGQGRGRSNPRRESITDLVYQNERLFVAGLSNEEFASSLRSIPFPFTEVSKGTSVEIFHGAHGRFETRSPVRTFAAYNIGGDPHLLAAYTCTPLVKIPVSDLKPGVHIKGTTIAELGNRNRPLDMIVYEKGGKEFILMANSSRGMMKITTENIAKTESIVDPVSGGGTKGLSYETLKAWTGIEQLDRLNDSYALVVRSTDGGALNLESLQLP